MPGMTEASPPTAAPPMDPLSHEQLPDAASGERLKTAWRASLGELKAALERPASE